MTADPDRAAFDRLCSSEPVLTDIRPAGDVVPGFTPDLILTSGAPLPWDRYVGGQREAILGAAQFERLATTREQAEARLAAGEIRIAPCHAYGCVGSVAGVYTASMPVFVVENRPYGNVGFCNFYEGNAPRRLNYGCWDDAVRDQLEYVHEHVAPVVAEAVRRSGGIELKPIMRRALNLGDELHSRNTAATMLFERALLPALLDIAAEDRRRVDATVEMLASSDYFFLRLSMAAAKAIADGAHGIAGQRRRDRARDRLRGVRDPCQRARRPVVHGAARGRRGEAVRGPHRGRDLVDGRRELHHRDGRPGRLRAGRGAGLQGYQGGSAAAMIDRNLAMYDICVGENTTFKLP